MLKGENGFYDEFRLAQQNLRANIVAGKGNTFAYTGAPGTSPLPIFMAFLQGIPLTRRAEPGSGAVHGVAVHAVRPGTTRSACTARALTGIAGTGTSGLQNGPRFEANAAQGGPAGQLLHAEPGGEARATPTWRRPRGNTRYNAMQVDLRRRMSTGSARAGQLRRTSSGARPGRQRSLREDWFYVRQHRRPGPLVQGQLGVRTAVRPGKKFGSGVSAAGRRRSSAAGKSTASPASRAAPSSTTAATGWWG